MTLRVAVLTMLEASAAGRSRPSAYQRIGGFTVARQQAMLALEMGCERVVCLATGLTPELIEIQHLVEARGAQFHVISRAAALVGLVSAVDEVIVLDDSLFASIGPAVELLEQGQVVLVQPIEAGLAAGFERIDINHAYGGAMRLPGRLVERLAEMPGDCDAGSTLLRIALQSGIRQKSIPRPDQDVLFWTKIRGEDEAHALEPLWIRQRTREEGALSLSGFLALTAVRRFGPALLHAGSGSRMLIIAASITVLLAVGAGWLGLATLGLALIALAWLLRVSAGMLDRIERDRPAPALWLNGMNLFGVAVDIALILLTAWGTQMHPGQHFIDRLFPPFMLIAILRILPRLVGPRWSAWLNDRMLLALVLAAAVLTGKGAEAVHFAAALAALVGMALPAMQTRITRA